MKQLYIIYLSMLLFLSGCMVGPDYKKPQFTPSCKFEDASYPLMTQNAPFVKWWHTFHDPILNQLITLAIQSNLDLKLATSRIKAAREQYIIARAPLFPSINVSGYYQRNRYSQDLPLIFTPKNPYQNLFLAEFDATWELDLFGGTKRAMESAVDSLQASVENRRSVLVTLLAEVSNNYLLLRGTQQQIIVVKQNIASQEDTYKLTKAQFDAGLTSDLTVMQIAALVEDTKALIPPLEQTEVQAMHRISVLLGREPGALKTLLCHVKDLPCMPPQIPIGLPSTLLCRRPDIREQERLLAAATANIGVAVANLYPQFALTGTYGQESSILSHFLRHTANIWSFAPNFTWPIFNGESLIANVHVQEELEIQAFVTYFQTILNALEDVENSLNAYTEELKRHNILAKEVEYDKQAFKYATALYIAGVSDFLNVLDAQKTLFTSEFALTQSRTNLYTDLIAIYKALGGGWECICLPN
ncbi:MAG: efflux transporter outer membrane subunit [Chlamydiales bacterium]|nr:efflux transporter outer membrane subunit [Chlamydiales bacterium]